MEFSSLNQLKVFNSGVKLKFYQMLEFKKNCTHFTLLFHVKIPSELAKLINKKDKIAMTI